MKIPELNQATSSESLRPGLSSIWVGKEDTVVTDGHIMIVHKTKGLFGGQFAKSIPEGGIKLSKRMIKDIRKKEIMAIMLTEDKTKIRLMPDPLDAYKYPVIEYMLEKEPYPIVKYKEVIPKMSEISLIDSIKLNPALIGKFSKAMSPDPANPFLLEFYFKSKVNGILVVPLTDNPNYKDSVGIIMPVQ